MLKVPRLLKTQDFLIVDINFYEKTSMFFIKFINFLPPKFYAIQYTATLMQAIHNIQHIDKYW